MQDLNQKVKYRNWAKQLRYKINLEIASNIITGKIVNLEVYKSAKTVMSYLPKEIEISLQSLFYDDSKKWFLPVVGKKDDEKLERKSQKSNEKKPSSVLYVVPYVPGETKLIKGKFGILGPEVIGDNFFDQIKKKIKLDLIFVPGLCFDVNGSRIGFGGGFYDEFLKLNSSSYKIGTCPKECLVARLPQEPFDIKVDLIITD